MEIPIQTRWNRVSAGAVTGCLLAMLSLGGLLFLLAALLTFFLSRIAAAGILIACFRCLPLYLSLVAPGPFRSVLRGDYSVPLQANFVWDWWSMSGLFALAVTAYTSVLNFRSLGKIRS